MFRQNIRVCVCFVQPSGFPVAKR